MNVKIINKSPFELPFYEHDGDSGMDLKAILDAPVTLDMLERVTIPTGIFIAPETTIETYIVDNKQKQLRSAIFEAQIRPKSGLCKKGIVTQFGTCDNSYRGEIAVTLINLSREKYTIQHGHKIAQIVFAEVKKATWELVNELPETSRGDGGFGSTGK